jgi:hypothetical protein
MFRRLFPHHERFIQNMDFSPNGKLVATFDVHGAVHIYHTFRPTGRENDLYKSFQLLRLKNTKFEGKNVRFASDAELITISEVQEICELRLWHVHTCELLHVVKFPEEDGVRMYDFCISIPKRLAIFSKFASSTFKKTTITFEQSEHANKKWIKRFCCLSLRTEYNQSI